MNSGDRDTRELLVMEALCKQNRVRLQVRGESMLPTLWPGDTVEILPAGIGSVSAGDIVLTSRDDRFFLHRILVVSEKDGIVTRGDSTPTCDPAGQQLLGKVAHAFRQGRDASIPLGTTLWSRIAGLALCHCGWARRLALRFHRMHPQAPAGAAIFELS